MVTLNQFMQRDCNFWTQRNRARMRPKPPQGAVYQKRLFGDGFFVIRFYVAGGRLGSLQFLGFGAQALYILAAGIFGADIGKIHVRRILYFLFGIFL